MLNFPEEFFQGEYRNDFYVDETMKRFWAGEMEVLAEVIRICEKYKLRYFADWGTLLGAIRHEGYIPWDDDIDIALLRPDYNRLIEVLPKELTGEYDFASPMTHDNCDSMHLCIRNASCISESRERLEKFHGCPFVVAIDIYPIDVIPRDETMRNTYTYLLKKVGYPIALIRENAPEEKILAAIQEVQDLLDIKFDFSKQIQAQLWRVINDLGTAMPLKAGDYVTVYPIYAHDQNFVIPKRCYQRSEKRKFENMFIDVPAAYDEVLRIKYGDYMVMKRGGSLHDYPAYAKQIEDLRRKLEELQRNGN